MCVCMCEMMIFEKCCWQMETEGVHVFVCVMMFTVDR